MKKHQLKLLFNPFIRIAGHKALLWGIMGLILSGFINYLNDWHYHGLLHYGPAPNPALWCFMAEQAIVWIIPATLFYIAGLILSKSRIRIVDVFGTTAFSLLPMIIANLMVFLPPYQYLKEFDPNLPPMEILQNPGLMTALYLSIFGSFFMIWSLIWMFNAFKISCNLKGYKLGVSYAVAIIGGDILCRIIINLFY